MNTRLEELISAVGEEAEEHLENILVELLQARVRLPDWPRDPVHASAFVNEEAGELTQAALGFYCLGGGTVRMDAGGVRTAAAALRFLMHLGGYRQKCRQP